MRWGLPLLAVLLGIGIGYLYRGEPSVSEVSVSVTSETSADSSAGVRGALPMSLETLELIEGMSGVERYLAIGELVEALPLSEYSHALQFLQDVDLSVRREVVTLIEQQWAAIEPQGMWDYTLTHKKGLEIFSNQESFIEWSAEDIDRAWDQTLALVDVDRRQQLLSILLKKQLPEDPVKVLQALSLVPDAGLFGPLTYERALDQVSAKDPHAVLHYLEMNEDLGRFSPLLYEKAFRALAKGNRGGALQVAAGLPVGPEKERAFIGCLDELVQDDFNGAIAYFNSIPMDSSAYEARKRLIRQIGIKDFESVKAIIASQPDPDVRREYYQSIRLGALTNRKSFDEILEVYLWAESQPTVNVWPNRKTMMYSQLVRNDLMQAEDLILELPPGEDRMIGLVALSDQLMKTDLQAAFDLAQDLSHVDEQERILRGMEDQLLREGVEYAGAFLLKNDDPYLQRNLSGDLVARWAKFDREAAHEWISHLTDPDALRSAKAELAVAWGKDDPAATANYIETEFDEKQRAEVYGRVVSNLADEDPIAAVEWLSHVPDGGLSNETAVYRGIASSYIRMDSMAASEWIAELDSGAHRDAAVDALVDSIKLSDSNAALIWANSVDDADMRKDLQRDAVREWGKRDFDAAYQAVKDTDIEASEKKSLFWHLERIDEPWYGSR